MLSPIAQHIMEIQELPTLPLIVTKIIQTTNDPRSSASDLNQLITNDQAIAAKVLKLANSAFYGLPGKVTSLGRAVTLLGFNTVRSLALSVSVIEAFGGAGRNGAFDRHKFWEHSLAVAACAKILATRCNFENKDEAHMAGLFHDIGKIILDQYFFEYFASAQQLARETPMPTTEAETAIMGVTHAEVGAMIAERWQFPPHLVEVIRHHHAPVPPAENPTLELVIVSNVLCQEWQFGDSGEPSPPPMADSLRAKYLPSKTEQDIIEAKLEAEVEKSAELLSLFR